MVEQSGRWPFKASREWAIKGVCAFDSTALFRAYRELVNERAGYDVRARQFRRWIGARGMSDRIADRALQTLRKAGLIKFNRSAQEWQATELRVEHGPTQEQ